MNCEESIKWLDSLIKTLGQSQYQSLWNWEQPLTEIKEMLESKRVVELPCKVGDTVYCLDTLVDEDKCDKCPFYYEGGMGDYPACEKSITGSRSAECIEIKEEIGTLKDILWWMFRNDFGKTVFLTKSEAEQKLKELQNEM